MKITNRYKLPTAIVSAVQNDPYTKGESDYSVSELISPPRKTVLTKKHYKDLEEDASDRIWSLFGQAVHHISERANIFDVVERRYYWTVQGKIVSGQVDNYNPKTGVVTDYKVTTVSKISFKDFSDWENQQNCYAQLMRWNGDLVTELQVLAIARDHRPREAETAASKGNPYAEKAQIITLPLWSTEKAIAFISERVSVHEKALHELPLCTPEERWASADAWAVKKPGQKNAVAGHSNYASKKTAEIAAVVLGSIYYLEHRPGRNRRCESYCAVSKFCTQYQSLAR